MQSQGYRAPWVLIPLTKKHALAQSNYHDQYETDLDTTLHATLSTHDSIHTSTLTKYL